MPKWTGTLIGGGIGWVLAGPIGALIGAAIGNMFNTDQAGTYRQTYSNQYYQGGYQKETRHQTKPGDFAVALLVLFAYVTKADKQILSAEIQYVKKYLIQKFGMGNAQEMMYLYKDILDKEYNIQHICQQVNFHLDHYSKLEMLHILFGIANADKRITEPELQAISLISGYLGISAAEYKSIQAIFVKQDNQAYGILGINRNATDEEIKKAYRDLAVKHHPDKVASLGEEFQKVAEEKFKAVNNAYQTIRQERGF
ncbi:MAG: TerB family tellurite resistance protein [Candidatus Marinimicrobia bacterium]|nr:TerB family tellurite resistance protein [Candidatus Neomarinimicrobiota bacterium]